MENQRIYGLNIELQIMNYLNEKHICDLNPKWKKHVLRMFPEAKDDDVIFARHYPDASAKPDLIFEINRREVFVSVKTGKRPSMHQESFFSFQRFLKRKHISHRTLRIIRFFHYGDSKKINKLQ